jgi:hypothetical protein
MTHGVRRSASEAACRDMSNHGRGLGQQLGEQRLREGQRPCWPGCEKAAILLGRPRRLLH